jgi:hypothetical protein
VLYLSLAVQALHVRAPYFIGHTSTVGHKARKQHGHQDGRGLVHWLHGLALLLQMLVLAWVALALPAFLVVLVLL